MKKQSQRLTLHRETVLCMQNLRPARVAAFGPLAGVVIPPETSPLCVSTCCGSCEALCAYNN